MCFQYKAEDNGNVDKPTGVLLYTLATSSDADVDKLSFVVNYIQKGKIASVPQLNGMCFFFVTFFDCSICCYCQERYLTKWSFHDRQGRSNQSQGIQRNSLANQKRQDEFF